MPQARIIDSFLLCLVTDTLLAVIGTAVFSADFAFRPYSVAAIIWKEVVVSIVIAAALGYFLGYKRPQDNAARWIWVLPTLWFLVGLLIPHDLLPGAAPRQHEILFFFGFTIPAIRAAAFSGGSLAAQKKSISVRG